MQLHIRFVFTVLKKQPPFDLECLTFYGVGWSGLPEHSEQPVESAEDCLSLCKSMGTQIFSWLRKRCVCKNKDNGGKLMRRTKDEGRITGEASCTGKFNSTINLCNWKVAAVEWFK